MKKNVKLLACLLAITMIASMASISSFAWEVSYNEDHTYDASVQGSDTYYIALTGVSFGDGPFTIYTEIWVDYSDYTTDHNFCGGSFDNPNSCITVELYPDTSKYVTTISTSHGVMSDLEFWHHTFTLYAGIDF